MTALSFDHAQSVIANFEETAGLGESASDVVVVDDHQLLAETLTEVLRLNGFRARHVDGESADEILEGVLANEPAVVILDYHLGDDIGDATQLIGPLAHAGAAVMVVTGDMTRLTAAECYEAGAQAVLTKGMPSSDLVSAVHRVAAGEWLVADDERHQLLRELREDRARRRNQLVRFEALTPREAHVLGMICEGLTAAEIAEASFVSMATVRSQIRSILMKLGVRSQLAAAADAYRSGWVDAQRENHSDW